MHSLGGRCQALPKALGATVLFQRGGPGQEGPAEAEGCGGGQGGGESGPGLPAGGWAGAQGARGVSPLSCLPRGAKATGGGGQLQAGPWPDLPHLPGCNHTSPSVLQSEHRLSHTHTQHFQPAPTCRDPQQSPLVHGGPRYPAPTGPPLGPHYPDEAEIQRQKQGREAESMWGKSFADPLRSTPGPGSARCSPASRICPGLVLQVKLYRNTPEWGS